MSRVRGLLLAAGAGRRFGGPKALARDADGTSWLARAAETLEAAGLQVLAVLPASRPDSRYLLPASATGLLVETMDEGLSGSLRAGLSALTGTAASAALITLVDLPGLPVDVLERILSPASPAADQIKENPGETAPDPHEHVTEGRVLLDLVSEGVLRRAVFEGRPGHPVLIGRLHWPALLSTLAGDTGAGAYLRAHGAEEIECSDLWDGADVDVR